MPDVNETYPFQVLVWIEPDGKNTSFFERGGWMEMARCMTKRRANEVAQSLAIRHRYVQAAELVREPSGGARFVGYAFYPESGRTLQQSLS